MDARMKGYRSIERSSRLGHRDGVVVTALNAGIQQALTADQAVGWVYPLDPGHLADGRPTAPPDQLFRLRTCRRLNTEAKGAPWQ